LPPFASRHAAAFAFRHVIFAAAASHFSVFTLMLAAFTLPAISPAAAYRFCCLALPAAITPLPPLFSRHLRRLLMLRGVASAPGGMRCAARSQTRCADTRKSMQAMLKYGRARPIMPPENASAARAQMRAPLAARWRQPMRPAAQRASAPCVRCAHTPAAAACVSAMYSLCRLLARDIAIVMRASRAAAA